MFVQPTPKPSTTHVASLALVAVCLAFAGPVAPQEAAHGPGDSSRAYVPMLPSPFCSQPGRIIRDLATFRDVIVIADDFVVTKLSVTLDVTHPSISDLEISIDDGEDTVDLIWDDCGFVNDLSVRIGDGAGPLPCGEPVVGSGDTTRNNPPREFLSTFNGRSIQGTWTLTVTDDGSGDQGVLNEWCIVTTPIPVELLEFEIE